MATKNDRYWDYSEVIFNALTSRLNEFAKKIEKGNFNPAYQIAFTIGCIADIRGELVKIVKKEKRWRK